MRKTGWRARARRIIESAPALNRKETALSAEENRMLESVRNAIESLGRYSNCRERLEVVDMVYWRHECTLRGAAERLHYSYQTVQEWNAEFLGLVDAFFRVASKK